MSCRATVVCLPLFTASLTSFTSNPSPGCNALSRDDFPAPLGPASALIFLASARAQFIHACAGLGRRVNHAVAQRLVQPKYLFRVLHQVDFVCDDDGWDPLFFRNDEEPVEHPQLWIRMCAGEDEDSLVAICQQNLLIDPPRPRVKPDDGLFPFLHLLDHPGPVPQTRDLYPVTDRREVAVMTSLLEPSAQLANDRALSGLHSKETRLGADDQAREVVLQSQVGCPYLGLGSWSGSRQEVWVCRADRRSGRTRVCFAACHK